MNVAGDRFDSGMSTSDSDSNKFNFSDSVSDLLPSLEDFLALGLNFGLALVSLFITVSLCALFPLPYTSILMILLLTGFWLRLREKHVSLTTRGRRRRGEE